MKRLFRQMAAFLAFCVLAAAVPPAGLAVEEDGLRSGYIDLKNLVESASDGETITLTGEAEVGAGHLATPWIISKNVTIKGNGYSVFVRTGGILLDADVTFENVDLRLTSADGRNAMIVNGHTLTLNGVTAGAASISVFCGTLLPAADESYITVPKPGGAGTVHILGKTNLQGNLSTLGSAKIFAGSLSMGIFGQNMGPEGDGTASDFLNNVTINIEDSAGSSALGTVYAGGGQNRTPSGETYGKDMLADSSKYRVGGTVTITGTNALPDVDGAGADRTDVVYRGDGNQDLKVLRDISSLSVKSGELALTSGSRLNGSQSLSVERDARLNLAPMTGVSNLKVQSFSGNGYLILGENQTWELDGTVEGNTTVAIGSMRPSDGNWVSGTTPKAGHKYIQAPRSQNGDFVLLPPAGSSNMTLENDGSGNWVATQPTQEASKLESLNPAASTQVSSGTTEAIIPLNPTCTVGAELPWESLPFDIYVNGQKATFDTDSNCYMVGDLGIYVGDFRTGDGVVLSVGHADLTYATAIPDDTYKIQITVPGEYTSTGDPITASCTLTVGDSAPTVTTISVPTANTGLKWTGEEQTGVSEGTGYTLTGHKGTAVGEYTAAATLEPNYQWTSGSTDPKTINWSIDKADGPAAPEGLSAVAPTTESGSDGQIIGTTSAMECSTKEGFFPSKHCGDSVTTGLAAGTYYVRVSETENQKPGMAALITVPAPNAALKEISVNSTTHKLEYKVGDPLDVTGMTIKAVYPDGSEQTVPVTADMVSGFDSSKTGYQLLTITYLDCKVSIYIRITASEKPKYQVTLNNLGDGGGGGGSYEEGSTVAIRAGSKSGYTFSAWQQPEGVTLANRNSPETSFTMPAKDVTLLATWTRNGGTTPPGHTHAWGTAWKSNASHHWHDCTASGCTAADNSEKDGYAAHTAGDWVIDQAATSTQSGVRHRSCTVCGYELARETIPATGGGSSSSGGSSSGGSSSSGGGSSSGGSSSNHASTVKNPDGSTTSTNTNRTTGAVTETTRRPDGSKLVVETKKDGTVTTTDTAKDGSTVKTVARPDGTSETAVKRADGLTASVREDGTGARADVRLPSKLVQESQGGGGTVALPIPELPGANASVTVRTGSVRPVRVEIPVRGDENTTVACVVNGDGTETILKTAVLTGGQITVSVPDGTTVRLRDNGKDFRDTRGHWAEDAIDFAASRELFAGKTSTAFAPDAPMSRAMLTAVLARLDGVDAAGGAAYEKGMAWAVAQGVSDGRNPEGQVTREQLAAMLYRYAGSPAATDRELHFSDEAAISGYAREAVRWAVENGILSGYGNGSFAPGGRATRAQAAVMLTRYVNYLNGQ